ncbi:hypothetical protein C462_04220 [Halorubrum distributum JCM 13916]|uniref:Uncharacterized protein n=1 Tax=Halorubrum distributum JCM 13916 TaxID=1230455 RepID=M0PPN8_9EURY|nr:hypothetical protein C462_04220 [Halorubrum arcis JCM 13916]
MLLTFASAPQGFILGALLEPLLSGLNSVVVGLLDLIVFVFQGDGPGLTGTLGLADIPLFIGDTLIGVGSTVGGSAIDGTGILGVVDRIVETFVGFASIGGPLAPLILAGEVVVVTYVLVVIARRTILVIADAIPGAAGVLGT